MAQTIETRIERAKLQAILKVNSDLLSLYWSIGNDILEKQRKLGWGAQVIDRLSSDLSHKFPDDRGFSVRNLKYMRMFAEAYPDFPFVQVPLAQITWYHHISLIPKVKDVAERALYILATAHEGWSRDTMLTQIANRYIEAKGSSINNFDLTLPSPQSDLAKHSTFCPRCKLFNSLTKNKSPKNKRKSRKNTYLCGIIKTTNQNVYT